MWLNIKFLTQVKMEERAQKEVFSAELPYYYYEITSLLLAECREEFGEDFKQVKSLIEDLYEIRREKLMRIMKKVDPELPIKFLSTVGCAELNYVRPEFTAGYGLINKV